MKVLHGRTQSRRAGHPSASESIAAATFLRIQYPLLRSPPVASRTIEPMTEAEEIHRSVQDAFNASDTEALVDLYAGDAVMATPDGTFVSGRDAIREQWSGFIALGGNIQMTTRYAAIAGEMALLSNDWHFTGAVWSCRHPPRRWPVVSLMGLGST
jgi:ketosteroid isomerase-like protein